MPARSKELFTLFDLSTSEIINKSVFLGQYTVWATGRKRVGLAGIDIPAVSDALFVRCVR